MTRPKGMSFVVFATFFIAMQVACNEVDQGTSSDFFEVLQQLKEITERIAKLEMTVASANNNSAAKMESAIKALVPQLVSEMKPALDNIATEQKHFMKGIGDGITGFMFEMGPKLTMIQIALSKLNRYLLTNEANDNRCQKGCTYFDNSCYFFSSDSANWITARQNCQAMGADFPKITTDSQWKYIAAMIEDNTWVGLNDLKKEGTFRWVMDGSLETGGNQEWWHEGQPDDYEGNEDCIQYWFFFSKLLWNDSNCQHKMRYVCKKKPTGTIN